MNLSGSHGAMSTPFCEARESGCLRGSQESPTPADRERRRASFDGMTGGEKGARMEGDGISA